MKSLHAAFLGAALLMTVGARAGNYSVGSQAAPWLNLDESARTAAMGGASVALAEGVNTLSVNPAGLGNLVRQQVSLTQNFYVQDTDLERVAYGLGLPGAGGLAAALNYMDYGSIAAYEVTTNNQLVSNGSLNPYGLSAEVGYGYTYGQFSGGLGLKLVTENLGVGGNNSAGGADLGLLWRQGAEQGFSAGFAVQNLGSQLDGADLPTNIQAGLGYRIPLAGLRQGLCFAADASVPTADAASEALSLGAEYSGDSLWALRAGYKYVGNNGISGLSAGAGLKYKIIDIDYAFVTEGVLGDANQVSLSAAF